MKGFARRVILAAVAVAAVAAGLALRGCGPIRAGPGSQAPHRHATNVAATDASLDESYFWRDGHAVMFLRHAPGASLFHVELTDTRAHTMTLPQLFNSHLSGLMTGVRMRVFGAGSSRGVIHYLPPSASLSPDGKWLLWLSAAQPPNHRWIAATLDGKLQEWKQTVGSGGQTRGGGPKPLWFHDSKRWVELVEERSAGAYSITEANVYALGKAVPVKHVYIRGLDEGLPLGITRDGTVMVYHPGRSGGSDLKAARFTLTPINADFVTARTVTVTIPASRWIDSVALSPAGDRLAWILEDGGTPPGPPRGSVMDRLTRLIGVQRRPAQRFTIYVSGLDGADFHRVATVKGAWSHGHFAFAHDVGWLPDGKQVSFIYNDALWTVPAK